MNLDEKIFRALLEFEAKGDFYEEKEKVILGCVANGSEVERMKKNLTTLDLEATLNGYTLDEINQVVNTLTEKDFIKSKKIIETSGKYYYELLKSECDINEFLEG